MICLAIEEIVNFTNQFYVYKNYYVDLSKTLNVAFSALADQPIAEKTFKTP